MADGIITGSSSTLRAQRIFGLRIDAQEVQMEMQQSYIAFIRGSADSFLMLL